MALNESGKSNSNKKTHETTAEVLYQKLGNRWYAFSLIDDEVFVGSISQDQIDAICVDGPQPGAAPILPANN